MKVLLAVMVLAMSIVQTRAADKVLVTYDLTALHQLDSKDPVQRRKIWDEQHLVAALQGLANRNEPRLYVFMVGQGGKTDHYWLDKLHSPGQWLSQYQIRPIADLPSLLAEFKNVYRGAVIYDERVPATALLASTIAGTDDLLPIRFDTHPDSLYQRFVVDPHGPRLTQRVRLINPDGSAMFTGKSSGSAKCDATMWAVKTYLQSGKCDPSHLGYYPDAYWLSGKTHVSADRTLLCNHDYFIAHRSFFCDLSPWDDETPDDDPAQPLGTDSKTLHSVFRAAYDQIENQKAKIKNDFIHVGGFTPWDQKYTKHTGQKHEGVATEWRFAEILSCYNAYMDADAPGLNAMANASVFQHFPLAPKYPQKNLPTEKDLRAKGYLDKSGHVVPRNYATIYVGDYDSAAWLYQKMPEIWDDPKRGKVPLGWAFNPALAMRFPVGMHVARSEASSNDTFISGDSGFGYLNPGYLDGNRKWSGLPSGLPAWEKLCTRAYARWDLKITGFAIDGNAPAMSRTVQESYARFSPIGVVAQKVPEASLVGAVPFLRMASDLPDAAKGAKIIASRFPADTHEPHFEIFRTILWTPTQHKEMFDELARARPDIQIVEPYTLFALLKKHLESH